MGAPVSTGRGPYLGLAEAANYLGVTTRTLRRYVSAGEVPASRLPGARLLRFRVADLDAMLRPVTSADGGAA